MYFPNIVFLCRLKNIIYPALSFTPWFLRFSSLHDLIISKLCLPIEVEGPGLDSGSEQQEWRLGRLTLWAQRAIARGPALEGAPRPPNGTSKKKGLRKKMEKKVKTKKRKREKEGKKSGKKEK